MGMLDDAEIELGKIDPSAAVDAIPVLALQLNICYRRKQWNKMAALATRLFLLDPSNPRWSYAHGFATAKIDSDREPNQTKKAESRDSLNKHPCKTRIYFSIRMSCCTTTRSTP
jgi:hypothetical protein